MLLVKIALLFEKLSKKIKNYLCTNAQKKFIAKYNLIDSKKTNPVSKHYNPYIGTNVLLIQELINSGEITSENHICDIGCGTGLFLIYLASKGFKHLIGYEIDKTLFETCTENILNNSTFQDLISIIYGDVFSVTLCDEIDCFYIFNSFADKDTYDKFFKLLHASILRRKREIKILILYPTVASFEAVRECNWLREKRRIIDQHQVCQNCYSILVCESI